MRVRRGSERTSTTREEAGAARIADGADRAQDPRRFTRTDEEVVDDGVAD